MKEMNRPTMEELRALYAEREKFEESETKGTDLLSSAADAAMKTAYLPIPTCPYPGCESIKISPKHQNAKFDDHGRRRMVCYECHKEFNQQRVIPLSISQQIELESKGFTPVEHSFFLPPV